MRSILIEGYYKFSLRKILSILIVILFITTIFSPASFAKSDKNNLIKSVIGKIDKNILDASTKAPEKYNDDKPGGFLKKIRDFIENIKTDRKEILPLHVVTKHNGIEKVTKMKLFRPTSIDVDNDGDKDVRVRVLRLPSVDLHPPALAMKTILIVHRLPGMNHIKNDLFEICLEYYPRIITRFFYLTQNIDLVRIGYQSPAGGEVPKTFILTDKTAPHLLYPKLKTSHKISINPGSSTGKYPLNLILSFIDLQNYSDSQGYTELKIMANYSPAVKIKDITFARSKDKFIGREQTIEITRDVEPSDVSFYYNQFIDYFSENSTDKNTSSMFTVGNIPKKIEIRFLIAKNGYVEINTHNEDMGYFKASINNAISFGFDPVTETHIRIGWENRTLLSYYIFDLSIETYNSVELSNFYFALTDFYKKFYNNYEIKNSSLKITASRLLLNINNSGKIANYTTFYFLFPISIGLSGATSIEWRTENLQIKAYDLSVDLKYLQNGSGRDLNKDSRSTDNVSNSHAYIKYLDFSSDASSLSFDLVAGSLHYSGGGNIDIQGFDFLGENINASFSWLSFYLSSSGDLLFGDTTRISVSGFLKIADLYYRNSNKKILQADFIQLFGNFSLDIPPRGAENNFSSMIHITGDGSLEIKNLYIYTSYDYYEYDTDFSFSYLNLSSSSSNIMYSTSKSASSSMENLALSIYGGFLEITSLCYKVYDANSTVEIVKADVIKLSRNFSLGMQSQTKTEDNASFAINSGGDGYLEIKNLNMSTNNYDLYDEELSFSCLNISSLPSGITRSWINSNSNFNENLSVFIENGLLKISDLYYKVYDLNSTYRIAQIYSIDVSNNLLLSIKFENSAESTSSLLSIDSDGSLELRNILIDEDVIHHEIDFINKSGDTSFSLFFPFGENIQNTYDFNHLDGVIEISGVRSSDPYLDALDHLYLDGNGDLKIETWRDADTSDMHIYLESQNGLALDLFSIELDNGINYDIERQGTIEGYIGPGFMHIGADLNGDGDGFVFIDSSEIDFEDVLFTYKSSTINKGLRFTPNIQSFDANSFLLQWDSFTLNNEDHTVIPYNWYKTGSISASFNIELIDGDSYYQLWPLDNLGGDNQELDMSEESYNEGTQPLETGPPKPQKPVGPHGGIIIGRIVKENEYTFSTLNSDIDQLLSYKWDWGDGTYSGWSVYLPSGVGVTGTHSWDQLGIKNIRVKAKNINGDESAWSDSFSITVRIKLADGEQNNDQNNYVEQTQNNYQGQSPNS
ncbi:MAG: PKD domain-containing protein [Euryarchaeota archaeon]|nr:PKD domain-containing protein [Euryarchaeota archaeon]